MSERNVSERVISKAKKPEDGKQRLDTSKEKAQAASGKKPEDGRQGLDTPKEKVQAASGKKPGGLKKANIAMLWTLVAVLMLLCVALLTRIRALDGTVEVLTGRIERMNQASLEQRKALELLTDRLKEAQEAGQGSGTGTGQQGAGTEGQGSPEDSEGNVGGASDGKGASNGGGTSGGEGASSEEGISASRKVYLTFDDGPSGYTDDVLEILDRYGVKATFFVVGGDSRASEETLRKIVEAGHTLGMHSCTHDYDTLYASAESFAADFARQQEYLYQATGVKSRVYRFPGGSSNSKSEIDMKVFAEYLDRQGVRFFDWNVSSGDGGGFVVPVETLVENCTKRIRKGTSVILMHDRKGNSTTVEALPQIIEKLQAMEDTVLLPITDGTEAVQHIRWQDGEDEE